MYCWFRFGHGLVSGVVAQNVNSVISEPNVCVPSEVSKTPYVEFPLAGIFAHIDDASTQQSRVVIVRIFIGILPWVGE